MSFDISVPVYSECIESSERAPTYVVCPLFLPDKQAFNEREDRALASLHRELQKELNAKAKGLDHRAIARLSFCPHVTTQRLRLELRLRKRSIRGDFFLASFAALNRKIVICPRIRDVSFELLRGQDLLTRATDVLTAHFRSMEREGDEIEPASFLANRHVRITELQLSVRVNQVLTPSVPRQFAVLGGSYKMSGAEELDRTGRCLNRLYPNDLQRAILREPMVNEVSLHFGKKQNNSASKPLVLVGPSQTGKTAIIHEYLRRQLDAEKGSRFEHWHLSPQRLISGMSFVGQWEERVLAIFNEAGLRHYVLFFDDLLGLFHAGKSAGSDLTVGHVLKRFLEEGKLRVLAEATPEAWRKLREVDRGFADYFRVVHVREPSDPETLRILIQCMQELESAFACDFSPAVLPLVLQLQRRFVRMRSFPGKAVDMLRQLAITHASKRIGPENAYAQFESKTGIRQQFLSPEKARGIGDARSYFENRIVGQEQAISAMIDAVAACTAQVNDSSRPLASMLFLGPTGVGKTECAKALAEYFFGDARRLIRFDMNEFVAGDAVARLVGTFAQPQGLLTAAVRRQPYAVLLLDEVEKADPAVFDLLLQILGDGRLTDAMGRTADFCNCIVVLTSNLGAQDARQKLGFGANSDDDSAVYTSAAQKFFRPELFNRLDRVIAFHRLGREHLQGMVQALINRALARQGISARRLILELAPGLSEALVSLGFKPEYGARALRRAIESHLVEPLALKIGELPRNEPASVQLAVSTAGNLQFDVRRYVEANRQSWRLRDVSTTAAVELVDKCNAFIHRIDAHLESWLSEDEGMAADDTIETVSISALRMHYFRLREELVHVRRTRDNLAAAAERVSRLSKTGTAGQSAQSRFGKTFVPTLQVPFSMKGRLLSGFYLAPDPGEFLKQLAQEATRANELTARAEEMVHRANRLEFLTNAQFSQPDRILVRINRSEEAKQSALVHDCQLSYLLWFGDAPNNEGVVVTLNPESGKAEAIAADSPRLNEMLAKPNECFIFGEGAGLLSQLSLEQGAQLLCDESGSISHFGVEIFPLASGESQEQALHRVMALPTIEHSDETPVSRLRHSNGFLLDLNAGLVTHDSSLPLRRWINPLFPPAAEFCHFTIDPADSNHG